MVQIGYMCIFRVNCVAITKHYYDSMSGKKRTLIEIFEHGIEFSAFTEEYQSRDIQF